MDTGIEVSSEGDIEVELARAVEVVKDDVGGDEGIVAVALDSIGCSILEGVVVEVQMQVVAEYVNKVH